MALPRPVCIHAPQSGFPPVAREDAKILILGSMPGQRSLAEQQYYAYPQNSFWPVIYRLLNSENTLDYGQKRRLLLDNHIALWDVLKKCERKGSLDADINPRTIALNDFQSFFSRHRVIKAVFFNGARAEQLFRRGVLQALTQIAPAPDYHRLPSTSPAHAALGFEEKCSRWRVILDYL